MIAGIALTAALAPGSQTALFIGFLVWPISFGIGMSLWYSLACTRLPRVLGRALFQSLKTGDLDASVRTELANLDYRRGQSTRVFVPVTVLLSFFASLAIASTPAARNFNLVVCAFTGFGLAYSIFLTWLARLGALPLPQVG